jgi:hypothetical protein
VLVSPESASARKQRASFGATKADVEKLLMEGEFPVEYEGTKNFFLQDSARIVAE